MNSKKEPFFRFLKKRLFFAPDLRRRWLLEGKIMEIELILPEDIKYK